MSEQPFAWHVGVCPQCERPNRTIGPLHGSEGGPPFCIQCGVAWHGKHGRQRRLARVVIKAIQMYYQAGGQLGHVEQFAKRAFFGDILDCFPEFLAKNGKQEFRHLFTGLKVNSTDAGELTTELLKNALRLTHPDHHPPERRELATRVTGELRALEPYVFAAPKPPEPVRRTPDPTAAHEPSPAAEPSPVSAYLCEACELTGPWHYCKACRTEFERRRDEKREKRNARRREQQRAWYRTRRDRERNRRQCFGHLPRCATCDATFEPKRKDAKYCTPTCRQRAYRRRVTDRSRLSGEQQNRRNAEAGGRSLDTGPRPGHPLPSHEAQT